MFFFTNLFKKSNDISSKSAIQKDNTDTVTNLLSYINQLFKSLANYNIKKITYYLKTPVKISKILNLAASWLEKLELKNFISKYPNFTKVYSFFFPDAIEVKVLSKPSEQRVTKKDNVVYVTFVK